jgi:hypothetical protein
MILSSTFCSMFVDDGIEKEINSQISNHPGSSFTKLLNDLKTFDYSQTIVQYIDDNGQKHQILPKKTDKQAVSLNQHLNSLQNVNTNLFPGAILNLSIDFINSIQHHIVSILYERFKSFTLPMEVDVPGVEISHIHINLEELEIENLNLFLSEEDNSVILKFSDLYMDAAADIHIEKYMVKESGSFSVKFLLEELIVKAVFIKDKTTQLMVPKFSVQLVDLSIPQDHMDVKLKLDYIPSVVSNFIISFVKGTLIDKITSFLTDYMPGDGSTKANDLIKQKYPNDIELIKDELLMGVLLTGPVVVKSDRLIANVDGIAYAKSTGKGKRIIPSQMVFTKDDGNDVVLGISEELIQSVMKSYISDINGNEYVKEFGVFKGVFKTNIDESSFKIWESGMKLDQVLVNGQISYLGFTFDINFKLNTSFVINKVDFMNKKFYITLNKVELTDYEFKSNIPLISYLGGYLKPLIETFGILIKNYSIPCSGPTLPFNIILDQIEFRYQSNFMIVKVDTEILD